MTSVAIFVGRAAPLSSPTPQLVHPPDRDVYQQLIKITGTVEGTAAKVNAMHEALLGEQGHIARLNADVERLYQRDARIREDLQASAKDSRSWRDQFKGGWWLVLAVLILLQMIATAATAAKVFAR